ncbi:hypothetical protein NDU88_000901 [Pleurodeles waltl]|uniref:Uncharacterized protein n=1 Tax=Pleurodeles waltl TaxID=8319 RepID=A0AAV7LW20_PLEWA|nr:hypothetical protein NDU88_000901 [Pleurodeles waltl]
MDKYAEPKMQAASENQASDTTNTPEPLLNTIMVAISNLKQTLEPKLGTVTRDVSLLRADLQKMTDKVNKARN